MDFRGRPIGKNGYTSHKNFELKKHRFFEGIFSNSRLGRGLGVAFGVSGRDFARYFARGLQVHKIIELRGS